MTDTVSSDTSDSRANRQSSLHGSAHRRGIKPKRIYLAARTLTIEAASNEPHTDGEKRPYLVMSRGRVTAAFRKQLHACGARIIGYVPEDTLLVRCATPSAIAQLPQTAWVGHYKRDYKLEGSLAQVCANQPGHRISVDVALFPGRGNVRERLAQLGAELEEQAEGIARVKMMAANVPALADHPLVAWIEPTPTYVVNNNAARSVTGVDAIWSSPGLTGLGQTLAIADTGLDTGVDNPSANGDIHDDFDNRVTFFNWKGSSPNDLNGHGTHMTGIAAGSGAARKNRKFAGVAKDAGIVFQGIGDDSGSLNVFPPAFLYGLFQQAYDAGASIHSNSWTSTNQTIYTAHTRYVDQFMWDNPNALILFAASNYGPDPSTIRAPANAKNCITVGASETDRPNKGSLADNPDQMASFSSRGPTRDGRIKPDVVAPGTYIIAPKSSLVGSNPLGWGSVDSNYCYGGGTSQSTAHVAGIAVLVRQYYTDIAGMTPSGALIKATLVNGAQDMLATAGTGPIANNDEGFGRSNATEALTPAAPRQLKHIDERTGLEIDGVKTYVIRVNSSSELRLTLGWTDYMSIFGAAKHLVNDLDVTLASPDGTRYNGNDTAAPFDDTTDNLNNLERIGISTPTPGLYVLTVRGTNVPEGPQPYAIALAGDAEFLPSVGDDVAAEFAQGANSDLIRVVEPGSVQAIAVPDDSLSVLSVSSELGLAYGAANAIDGDPTTLWATAPSNPPTPEQISLDLGTNAWVNRLTIFSGTSNFSGTTGNGKPTFTPIDFDIETSTDGTNWTVRKSITGFFAQWAAWHRFDFPPVFARYVRFTAKNTTFWDGNQEDSDVGDFYYCSVAEIGLAYHPEGTIIGASSMLTGYETQSATDSDTRSMWVSAGSSAATDPEWITVDLGYERYLSRLKMHSGIQDFSSRTLDGSATYCPPSFEIRTSSDGVAWTTAASISSFNPPLDTWTEWSFATPVRARYVQLSISEKKPYDNNQNDSVDPGELYFVAVPELAVSNDAPLVTASSSQLMPDRAAHMAADGNLSTSWASVAWNNGGQQALTLDLNAPRSIQGLRLYSGDHEDENEVTVGGEATFSPIDFTIETSIDATSWTTRKTVTGHAPAIHTWTQFDFPAVDARYLRLVTTRSPIFDANGNGAADPTEVQYTVLAEMVPVVEFHEETFVSRTLDQGSAKPIASVNWDAATPTGTSVHVQVRAGNNPDLSALPWVPADTAAFIDPTAINDPTANARYIQYRLRLRRENQNSTTSVGAVAITAD